VTISRIRGRALAKRTITKFGVRGRDVDIIICFKFYRNRLRAFRAVRGQIWGSSIDFDRHPYNRSALPCCLWLISPRLAKILSLRFSMEHLLEGLNGVGATEISEWSSTAADHVGTCQRCVWYLQQLPSVTRVLLAESAKTVVHAFIFSRVDYCNSLLFGISDNLLRRLQAIQNAATRLVTGTRHSEHITPVLRQFYWLPVQQCIEFKLAVLVYKAMNGLSPHYLADDCQLTSTAGRRRLWSSLIATCEVPRTRTSSVDRSFIVTGPRLWNSLPLHLRNSEHSTYFPGVPPPVTEDALVLLRTAAPSDCLLLRAL